MFKTVLTLGTQMCVTILNDTLLITELHVITFHLAFPRKQNSYKQLFIFWDLLDQ